MTACVVDHGVQTRSQVILFDSGLIPNVLSTIAKIKTVASEEFETLVERPSHPAAYALDALGIVLEDLKEDSMQVSSDPMDGREMACVLESALRDLNRVANETEDSIAREDSNKPVLSFCKRRISDIRRSLNYFARKSIFDIYVITHSESPDLKEFTTSNKTLEKIFNLSRTLSNLEKKVERNLLELK